MTFFCHHHDKCSEKREQETEHNVKVDGWVLNTGDN